MANNTSWNNQYPTVIEADIDMDRTHIEASVSLRSGRNIEIEMRDVPIGTGTNNYETLRNKPSIESVTLVGDKTFEQLGLTPLSADDLLDILV